MEIDLRQDVAEGFIRQTEQQIVFAAQFPLEVKADVRQRLTGNCQDLGISEIDEVDSCVDRPVILVRILEG